MSAPTQINSHQSSVREAKLTKRKGFLIAALIHLPLFYGSELHGQSLTSTLARLESSRTDTAKDNAFTELLSLGSKDQFPVCSPQASVQIKRALTTALRKENGMFQDGGGYPSPRGYSEVETEHYANLVGCVAALRDPNALPELLGAIQTGGGAINGVVALGEAAVPQLLRAFDVPASRDRNAIVMAAVMAAGKIASRNSSPGNRDPSAKLSATAVAAIRGSLLKAVRDQNRFIREMTIESLSSYSDAEVRGTVASVAMADPASISLVDGRKEYPVRRAAQNWLRQDSLKSTR